MEGSDNGYSKSLLNFDGESRLVGSSPTPSASWKNIMTNGFSKIFIILIFAIVLLVIAGGLLFWFLNKGLAISVSGEGEITISSLYKKCGADSDCVFIASHCGYCLCGATLNKKFQEAYEKKFETICQNYSGPQCEISCPKSEAKCVDNVCMEIITD